MTDQEYWLPRMHFTTDTVTSLRSTGSWLADWIDATATPQPTLGLLWRYVADLRGGGIGQLNGSMPIWPAGVLARPGVESARRLPPLPSRLTHRTSCCLTGDGSKGDSSPSLELIDATEPKVPPPTQHTHNCMLQAADA